MTRVDSNSRFVGKNSYYCYISYQIILYNELVIGSSYCIVWLWRWQTRRAVTSGELHSLCFEEKRRWMVRRGLRWSDRTFPWKLCPTCLIPPTSLRFLIYAFIFLLLFFCLGLLCWYAVFQRSKQLFFTGFTYSVESCSFFLCEGGHFCIHTYFVTKITFVINIYCNVEI